MNDLPTADSATQRSDIGCINLRWSLALLDGLIQGGVQRLVLSPGSRSTPVVLAAQRRPELTLNPILDERSAAFFALGVARATNRPVAVLATSGSAPAHWYPAVIEAAESGVPLILLSADRPPLLHHWGANQTIDQTRLFGSFAREFHDPGLPLGDPKSLKAIRALGRRAALQSRAAEPGPVQINLPFDEPLLPGAHCPEWSIAEHRTQNPGGTADAWPSAAGRRVGDLLGTADAVPSLPAGRGLMLCGPGSAATPSASAAILGCARALQLPLLADPLSGVRFTPASAAEPPSNQPPTPVIRHYDALLRNPAAAARLRPDWVLRLGRAPVSKALDQWLSGVPGLLVSPGPRWCDPGQDGIGLLHGHADAFCKALERQGPGDASNAAWLEHWQAADARVGEIAARHLATAPWCEAHLIQTLMQRIPAEEGLLCANSLPIRQLDTWSYPRAQAIRIFGNRGVSGIDGQVSTLAGLNAAGAPTWGLLGDLSFCHDLSGLLLAAELKRPVIVINNGGGRIFDYLPQHGIPGFEDFWRTPVAPDLADLSQAFGISYRRAADAPSFAAALAEMPSPLLIEVRIDAERSRQTHLAFWRCVAQASLLGDHDDSP